MTSVEKVHVTPYPGLDLTVVKRGEGNPILVLHGGGGPASMREIEEHFAATNTVYAPIHPGWDDTPRPGWFSRVDDLVETYLDVLEDLGLTDVTLIGSSFGGWIATEMALRDRGRQISKLILMDSIGPKLLHQSTNIPPASGRELWSSASVENEPLEGIDLLHTYIGPSQGDPKLFGRLHRIDVPVLLVWGENDQVVTPDFGREFQSGFKDARFVEIEGGSHVPTEDQPEKTLRAMDAFLREEAGN